MISGTFINWLIKHCKDLEELVSINESVLIWSFRHSTAALTTFTFEYLKPNKIRVVQNVGAAELCVQSVKSELGCG